MKAAALTLVVLLHGCDGCDGATAETSSGSSAPSESGRTVDGYPVVTAPRSPRESQADDARLLRSPNQPDPFGRPMTLSEAVVDLPVDGQLVAEIRTDLGTLLCDLFADDVPLVVANFVGLARGLRPWWDPRAGEWTSGRSLYDETRVSKVVPGQFVQMGDVLGDGSGWVGYEQAPERGRSDRRHDRPGQLAMLTRPSGKYGGRFILTDGANPDLDGTAPVFGQCADPSIGERIARVPQGSGNRPLTDVVVERVIIRRVAGGAADARPLRPGLPEGTSPEGTPSERGASPSPAELDLSSQIRSRRRAAQHRH